MKNYLLLVTVAALLVGCANPLNRITSDNYLETCRIAEIERRLDVAEEACQRALTNVYWGNLGSELESERLYNLGRIKNILGKYSEAEVLFNKSLAIEQSAETPNAPKMRRRIILLSLSLGGQDKWEKGAETLELIIPFTANVPENERSFVVESLSGYGEQMRTLNILDKAILFESAANRVLRGKT